MEFVSKFLFFVLIVLNSLIAGVKMIPPGIHFVYYSSVNLKGDEKN
jgi:hypothetical protein